MNLKEFLFKKKNFEFYILNINRNIVDYNEIIRLFCDSLLSSYSYVDSGFTVVVSSSYNSGIQQLVNALINDFGIKLKVFKSNLIDVGHFEYFQILKNLYLKYQRSISLSLITVKDLAFYLVDKNLEDILLIKKIILEPIEKDPKIKEVINGMFVNNLNVSKTAKYVYMHRNTINNKIASLKEKTGFDIRLFQDAVVLYVLLKK